MSQRGLMVRSRYPRGLLPSLGAGGSLIGAVFVLGGIVSGLIAVGGWPGTGAAARGGDVTLGALSRPVAAQPPRRRPVAGHVATTTATAAARPAPHAGRRPHVAHRVVSSPRATVRGGTVVAPRASHRAPVRSPAPTAAAPASPAPATHSTTAPAPAKTPAPVVPVPSVPVPAQPVTTVVHTVRQTLPPLPPAVQPVVNAVGSVAEGVAQTADGVVGGLLTAQP